MGSTSVTLSGLAVLLLGLLQSAAAISQAVPAYGCTGYQFSMNLEKYNFTSYMGSYTTPTGCNSTYVKVSKMFVEGACVRSRNNNFGVLTSIQNLNCDTTEDATSATCEAVMANGPAQSLIYGPRVDDELDSEQVCWPTRRAFMYVYNGCPAAINVTITAKINPYEGSCDIIRVLGNNKVGLSKGQIAGIAVAAIVGLLLLVVIIGGIVWCSCCQLKR